MNERSAGRAWAPVIRRDPCSYCSGPGGTVDHLKPSRRSRRGSRMGPDNMAGACVECNQQKGNKKLLLFLIERAKEGSK